MTRRTYNLGLSDLPSDDEVLAAVKWVVENDARAQRSMGASANLISGRLKIAGARRLGRGAVAHSWSGYMSGALRISPRLLSLSKRGLLHKLYDREHYRNVYILTGDGEARLKEIG